MENATEKRTTLVVSQKIELGNWIREQKNSPMTYRQLAEYATAELGFFCTPAIIEGMWRSINGPRVTHQPKECEKQPTLPEGMVLIRVEELHHLHEINAKHEALIIGLLAIIEKAK